MRILGIETSCDETGVAIYDSTVGVGLLANVLYSQIPLHAVFGGVVPELASRDHIRKILPLTKEALLSAKLELKDIDAIAYTAGPGLVGALLVGAAFGQSLGFALNIPTIAVHHLTAHLLAVFLEGNCNESSSTKAQCFPKFPFVALLVSGGHTQLIQVADIGKYQLLGETLDDAAGEAFDKVGKTLGLDYPAGAALSDLAQYGDRNRFHFPRPMVDRPGLDFSFSGLKTFAANTWLKYRKGVAITSGRVGSNQSSYGIGVDDDEVDGSDFDRQLRADIACAFQDAVIDTLAIKCNRALQQAKLNQLVLAGGVSANLELRKKLHCLAKSEGFSLYYPQPQFCTDNGAMIAYAGYRHLLNNESNANGLAINVFPRWWTQT